MQVPLEIGFEGFDHSDAIETRVRDEVDRLEHFHDRITACRVVVAKPHRHSHKGEAYEVRIHISLPGGAHIDVSREPGDRNAHADVYVSIRDAFAAARRQLQNKVRRQEGKVKIHEAPPHGRIDALFPNHGFIAAADGQQVYFERSSVHEDGFDALDEGQEVRFSEEQGADGPRATHVQAIGKHHLD